MVSTGGRSVHWDGVGMGRVVSTVPAVCDVVGEVDVVGVVACSLVEDDVDAEGADDGEDVDVGWITLHELTMSGITSRLRIS